MLVDDMPVSDIIIFWMTDMLSVGLLTMNAPSVQQADDVARIR